MEVFDLDFHILTPGGRDEHILSTVNGKVVVVPPANRQLDQFGKLDVAAPAQPARGK